MNRNKTSTAAPGWACLDATTLKYLAAALMLLDHIHQMFVSAGAPLWLTMLGRPVFPIFLFLAADSFHYTSSKRKYLRRLLLSSWGMTVLTFLVQLLIPNRDIVLMNNAFSTFFVAGLYMLFWDWFVRGVREKRPGLAVKAVLCCFIPVLCTAPIFLLGTVASRYVLPLPFVRFLAMLSLLVPNVLAVEGGIAMLALGVLFYILRSRRLLQVLVLLLLSAAVYVIDGGIQWMMCFAAIPMLLYNGQRGRGQKQFFYVFYPLHIVLLYLLATFTV